MSALHRSHSATIYILSNCPLVAGTPMSHHSAAAERAATSTSTAPRPPPKADLIVSSDHPLEQSANQSENLGADVHITQPISSQQQAPQPISSSTSLATPHTPANIQTPMASTQLLANETQEDVPDLVDVLGVISRSRLTPRERQALINNLASERGTPADLARANTVSSPPPYTG